ncbi:hypothetical protein [Winogradskyella alexanderae]|uniref:Phosphoribulokinase/uridine kinase domain-containing protein n=1 Tax=Winogradskyella alexanderae TaxID=2877123 RepID=A0ABS7XSR4_9FLAO|nr:hypothetical protein [Winogradskyella alexanderae]MCA0132509.1 hypothetical protein [Winogradskyella alexanderae]
MIGDKLTYHSSFENTNNKIIAKLKSQLNAKSRICIAVGGESGSGKTSLAYALFVDIETKLGLKGFLFHGDDYFYLPPQDNHNKRLDDICNVGPSEVNLKLLDEHLESFLKNTGEITKPLVHYKKNIISKEVLNTKDFNFCVVEGTYTMLLEQPTYKVFIENSFIDTKLNREKRARDIMDDFNERVLEIEHNIIKAQRIYADMIVKNSILD